MGKRTVLVTGATGFVGRALVADLLARGVAVRAATRAAASGRLPGGAEVVPVGEIGPETAWSDALRGAEAVVHLAAHVHVAPERAEAEAPVFNAVNHLGTVRLFEEAARHGVTTFAFVSSITVLGGETRPGAPFDDRSMPQPVGPYARSKHAAERALAARASHGGPRVVILRPPLLSGPGVGGNLASLLRLAALPLPLPFAGVENRRTLLALDNLVSAIGRVLERPEAAAAGLPYALGDLHALSTGEIVRHLRHGLGRRPLLFRAPDALLRGAADLIGRPGLHRRLCGSLEVDASRFREDFGWQDVTDTATSLRQAARRRDGR